MRKGLVAQACLNSLYKWEWPLIDPLASTAQVLELWGSSPPNLASRRKIINDREVYKFHETI